MRKAQAKILITLEAGPAPVGLIAELCGYVKGHVAAYTGGLVKLGLIETKPWPYDPDAKYAYALTDKGRKALEEANIVVAGGRLDKTNAPSAIHNDQADPGMSKLLSARW